MARETVCVLVLLASSSCSPDLERREGALLARLVDLPAAATTAHVTVTRARVSRTATASVSDSSAMLEILGVPVGPAALAARVQDAAGRTLEERRQEVEVLEGARTVRVSFSRAEADGGPHDAGPTDAARADAGPRTFISAPTALRIRDVRADAITGMVLSATEDASASTLEPALRAAEVEFGGPATSLAVHALRVELDPSSNVSGLQQLWERVDVALLDRDTQTEVDVATGPVSGDGIDLQVAAQTGIATLFDALRAGRFRVRLRGPTLQDATSGFRADVVVRITWVLRR